MVGNSPKAGKQVGDKAAQRNIVGYSAQGKVDKPDAQIICKQNIEGIFPRQPAAVRKLHEIKSSERGNKHQNRQTNFRAGKMFLKKLFDCVHNNSFQNKIEPLLPQTANNSRLASKVLRQDIIV